VTPPILLVPPAPPILVPLVPPASPSA
jgi:hypothetical protein